MYWKIDSYLTVRVLVNILYHNLILNSIDAGKRWKAFQVKQAQICADLVAKVADICFLVLKEGVQLLQYYKNSVQR